MVDLSRRKTILGMGLLAGGSGAAFTSATFQDAVEPGATLEVLADGNIVVEGTTAASNVENVDGNSLFDNGGIAEDIDRDDLPAARVNDESNSNLEIEVLIELRETGDFDPLLEVTNGDPDPVDIWIDYEDGDGNSFYGNEVDNSENDLEPGDVQTIYQFKTGGGDRISPAPDYTEDVDNTGENQLTVDSGETEQITLDLDTDFNSGGDGGDITGIINSIDGEGTRGFGESSTGMNVNLLNGIRVVADSQAE